MESEDVVENDPSPSSDAIVTTNSNGNLEKDIDDDDDEKKINKEESLPIPLPIPLESTTTTTTVTTTTTKGKGLKKWRRLPRRDYVEEEEESGSSSSIDPNRILKRDLRSDNSEDPSSNKSSTAAIINVPIRFRSHRSSISNNTSNRSSSSVKNHHNNNAFGGYSSSSPRTSKIESTKKLRGSTSRIDKDASYSSVESDLRSSAANVFFPTENIISNGKHINYDVDNSSEAQASDQQSNDYVQTNYFKDNGEEEVSQDDDAGEASWEAKEEQSENQRQSTSRDLLTESIQSLQAVRGALEKELQHFGEIGKEPILLFDDSADPLVMKPEFHSAISEIQENESSGLAEEIEKNGSLPLEAELIKIQSKVDLLEQKLEEATTILEVKESKIVELEGILNERESPMEEPGSSLHEKCREMETELDDLFKQKIEAEVECLAMRKISQKLKIASEDQITLFEEQKTLIGEQNKLLHKFRDTESKIATTKEQVDKLVSFGDSLDTDEVLKTQSRIPKLTFCFFVQLLLLCLVFGMLFLQSWPGSTGYVPT